MAEQKEIAEKVLDRLPQTGEMSAKVSREQVRTDEESREALDRSRDRYLTRTKKTETRNRPIQMAEKATDCLESIDQNILKKLSDSELRRMHRQLALLEQRLADIKASLP